MSEWLQLTLAILGSTTLTGGAVAGIGAWFKGRREDRKAAAEERQAEKAAQEKRIADLQAKIESLLMDAMARERETIAQLTERIEMDKKQNEVIAAATAALKEAAAALSKEKGP